MKKAITWFKNLVSNSPDASSKRLMALVVTFVVIAIAFINIFTGKVITDYIFHGLITLAAIGWGAVSVENIGQFVTNYMKKKTDN